MGYAPGLKSVQQRPERSKNALKIRLRQLKMNWDREGLTKCRRANVINF